MKTNRVLEKGKLYIKCLECGYASESILCENCKLANNPKCKYCEIVLRNEPKRISYYYDDRLREHTKKIKNHAKKFSEDLCVECENKIFEIKQNYVKLNMCRYCGNTLIQNVTPDKMVEYYRINGLSCRTCQNMMGIFPELFE